MKTVPYTAEYRGIGRPDHTAPTPLGQAPKGLEGYTLTDVGELAARLKSIDTFDRRGDVLWLDDFEDGLTAWVPDTSGVGASVSWSTLQRRSGACSCRLVTGNVATNRARIQHYQPYAALSALSLECHVTLPSNVNFLFGLYLFDGSKYDQAFIQVDTVNRLIQYLSPAGTYITIASGLSFQNVDYLFEAYKVVADFRTRKYVRLIRNSDEYNLSRLDLYSIANPQPPHLRGDISIYTQVPVNKTSYVDDAIFKKNEPPNILT